MKPVDVRPPASHELRALARLRIEWAALDPQPSAADEWAYADDLRAWLDRMGDRVICRVAAVGDRLIGMAWLVVFDRVPDITDRQRRTGDIQSLYVVPAARDHGVARALVDSLCAEADRRGMRRVTVRSSERAVPLYEAAGFRSTPTLLERTLPEQR